jgi:hypothetical protein
VKTLTCEVVASKVWHSEENRFLVTGDRIEFPAEVKNHEGKLVPFKVGDSFKLVEEDKPEGKAKAKKAEGDESKAKKAEGDESKAKKAEGDDPLV